MNLLLFIVFALTFSNCNLYEERIYGYCRTFEIFYDKIPEELQEIQIYFIKKM